MPDPATIAAITTAALLLAAQTILAWAACRMAGFNRETENG